MSAQEETYYIIRKFKNSEHRDTKIKDDLTLKEAQEHCRDPETSSQTATSPEAKALTAKCGDWMDVFYRH